MAVNLKKGQEVSMISLAKNPEKGIKNIRVGLGWDPEKRWFASNIDVDASVHCYNKNGSVVETVYFSHKKNRNGSIRHGGDNLTGHGSGDDEVIEIKLDEIPQEVVKLNIIINIYEAYSRRQSFDKVKNCYVHILDKDARNEEICRYELDDRYTDMTGIHVAHFYRDGNSWTFKAVGEGVRVKNLMEMK